MLVKGFYMMLGLLDYYVYKLASIIMSIIIEISNREIFDSQVIEDVANRIYIVVGVLILFKLVISAVQFMVNPDQFDDKEKGLGGILKKTVITIIMITVAPAVFNFMMAIQSTVVEEIPNIIFGTNESEDSKNTTDEMMFNVLSSFVELNENKKNESNDIKDLESFRDNISEGCDNGGNVLGGIIKLGDPKSCKYNYMIFISTIAGGFLCYVLLSMTLDVAIRVFKFGLIRILAPIPISSYVFSKDRLSKFIKTTMTVYCDLFIRLAIVYFIIFAANKIMKANIITEISGEDWFKKVLVNVAMFGGLFMFAKNAPKFITELLGLPDVGAGDMKDMFKPFWQRAGILGAAGGMFAAGAGNAINKAKFMDWNKGNTTGQKLKNAALNAAKVVGSGAAGAASAGFHGGMAAAQGKNTKEVNAAGYKRAIKARQNRDLDRLNGVTAFDRAKTKIGDELGIDTQASLAENKQKAYSTLHSDVGSFKKAVMGRIDKNPSVAMRSEVKAGSAIDQLGQMLAANAAVINSGSNQDLKNILNKFEYKSYTEKDGSVKWAYALKKDQHLGYYDLEAVRVNAEQEHIGSISGKIEPLKTIAQKEIFSDAMAGKVEDISGNLIDEINYGDSEYRRRGIAKANDAHSDITTAVQSAMQHITENGVPLSNDPVLLQKWFQGTVDINNEEDAKLLAKLPPELQSKIVGKDFGSLDDYYQRESERISGEMASSKEHLARASLERRDANKDKK